MRRTMVIMGVSVVACLSGLALPALASAASWKVGTPVAITAPGVNPTLVAVGCSSPGTCTAVGNADIAKADAPADCGPFESDGNGGVVAGSCDYLIAAQETDGTWKPAKVVTGASVHDEASPEGIACTSPETCIVVLYAYNSTGLNKLWYLTESDGSWGSLEAMDPPGNAYNKGGISLPDAIGVSCSSASHCLAAGNFEVNEGDGGPSYGMSAVGTVDGLGAYTQTTTAEDLYAGVACVPEVSTCTISGEEFESPYWEVTAQTEGGSVDTITSGGGDNGQGREAAQDAIACPHVNDCTVGAFEPASYHTAYQLSTVQETKGNWGSPSDTSSDGALAAGSGIFQGTISCVSVANCAWGGYGDDTYNSESGLFYPQATFANALDGTWSGFHPSPQPSDRQAPADGGSQSQSVSCAGQVCTFVGSYASKESTDVAYSFPATLVTEQCVVPNVVGKTLSAAKDALSKAHCALGTVTKKESAKPVGTVLSQSEKPGKVLPVNTPVAVVVAKH